MPPSILISALEAVPTSGRGSR